MSDAPESSNDERDDPKDAGPVTGSLLAGKRGLVVGVANQRSIAWGIARSAAAQGAELAFTFQGDALEKRVRPLATGIGAEIIEPLDVTDAEAMSRLFALLDERWGQLDFLVHSVAYAEREDLKGRTIETSRDGFLKAMEISAYSLISLSRAAEPLMKNGGSIMAMTYLGAVQAVPNYNVMGIAKAALESAIRYLALDMGPNRIRVNGLSAGPIKTLAASGVAGLRGLLAQASERAPLKRNVDINDVGGAGVYLASDLSAGTTGQILYVDAGLNITAW